ncbi:prolyl-tRNA synthetase associated domain-containing protein [Vagococcus sp. PNs007]|uniref:Prolyl-tRNA synthetase associated domain-containing protein n=1 Tax=Vagococcus proximus TaxID=2991417 RepID=A0ABT5X0P5_9ENTE|nr:YbaK/EbsC family protein [Vagococcus proximus]MDF0479572.1 prolyl-tRNA synthetase associated domain-containing protein [Vagococcus proximus]
MKNIRDVFEDLCIDYDVINHPPITTIEEMNSLSLKNTDRIAKNLFLRDDKKRNYYIIVVKNTYRVNLKELKATIGSRPLSFASEKDLNHYLSLERGAVTPLGVINNKINNVTVVIDSYFESGIIGVHPNVNTSTVFLETKDLKLFIEKCGNVVESIEFD